MCYRIAEKIVEQEQLPVACYYLEGSRYAWRLAEYYLPDTDIIGKLCIGGVHVTLRKILKRGGLTDREAERVASVLGKTDEMDRQLSYAEVVRMKTSLAACRELELLVHAHAREAYQLTVRYFRQEGLLETEKLAVVDSGWIGSLQQTLERLLHFAAKEDPVRKAEKEITLQGFYFGMYELPRGADPAKYHAYYFAPYVDIEKKVRFSNCLFEAVCSAKEGMTIGYREEGGRIVPVYETGSNPNASVIEKNNRLLEQALNDYRSLSAMELPLEEVRIRLEQLMSMPTKQQAEDYGSYLFSDDVSDGSLQPVAVLMTREEINNQHVLRRLLWMKGIIKTDYKDSAWPEGSIVRSGCHTAYHLWHCRMYKRMVYLRKRLKAKRKAAIGIKINYG